MKLGREKLGQKVERADRESRERLHGQEAHEGERKDAFVWGIHDGLGIESVRGGASNAKTLSGLTRRKRVRKTGLVQRPLAPSRAAPITRTRSQLGLSDRRRTMTRCVQDSVLRVKRLATNASPRMAT